MDPDSNRSIGREGLSDSEAFSTTEILQDVVDRVADEQTDVAAVAVVVVTRAGALEVLSTDPALATGIEVADG